MRENASSPLVDESLARATREFFPDATSIQPAPDRNHLAKVESSGRTWAVRRWPEGTPQARLDFLDTLLTETRAAGIDFVPEVAKRPDGGTAVTIDGVLYDAQSWLPGRSPLRGPDLVDERGRGINRPSPLSAEAMNAAIRALATFHAATESIAARGDVPKAPMESVVRAVRTNWEGQRQRLRPLAPRTPHIQRWLRSAEVVVAGAVDSIAASDFLRARPAVIDHLNLWPAHLLLSRVEGRDRLSGLIDFADAAAGSPLLDLAQIVGHFNGWTGGAAEESIGAYADVRPLAPEERRLLPAIAGLDLIIETGRLLILGYATRSIVDSGGGDTIRAGAATLLLSLEALAPAVQRGDRPEPSRARKWNYGPRPGGPGPRRGGGAPGGQRPGKPGGSGTRSGGTDRGTS
jgi:Ser/Thr protein kinase RdoA (MazF antagonist)